jgi:heat shock protein HtpX
VGNSQKTAALLALLTVLLVLVGHILGGMTGMVVAVLLALLMNAGTYWFSDRLVLALAGASEVSVENAPEIHRMIERLASSAGIPKPRVYVVESTIPNAFATGRHPSCASVAVTMGIVNALSTEELAGVLAHEIAHVRNRDTLLATVVASIAGAIMSVAIHAQRMLSLGRPRHDDGRDRDNSDARAKVGGIALIVVAPIAATLIRLAIPRAREFEADAAGARILGDPLPLASALEKMARANRMASLGVNPAIAHQFTVHPFVGDGPMTLFSTHPPTAERVARLREMALRDSFSSVAL